MTNRMEINGMPIKDLKEVQDVLAAFQTLNITTETLIEELAKQADEYKEIVSSFDNNHAAHGEIVAALTQEQIKLQQLTSIIDKMSLSTAHTAKDMLDMFQSGLQSKIDTAFNRVDDSTLHRSLQQTIENSLAKVDTKAIDKATKSMNEGAAKIDKLDQVATRTLNEIFRSVKEFNETVVNRFNKKMMIAVGSTAMIFGLIIGVLGHNAIIDKNLIYWTADINHRYFNQPDEGYYMRFTREEAKLINEINTNEKPDGYYYVKIKDIKY